MNDYRIEIYGDGACQPNPGKGGFGSLVKCSNETRVFYGKLENTTNCQAELKAIIEPLKNLYHLQKNKYDLYIYTDSKYVSDPFNKNWIKSWYEKDFKDIKNVKLWKSLIKLLVPHNDYNFIHIPRNSCDEHKKVDQLAKIASTLK